MLRYNDFEPKCEVVNIMHSCSKVFVSLRVYCTFCFGKQRIIGAKDKNWGIGY